MATLLLRSDKATLWVVHGNSSNFLPFYRRMPGQAIAVLLHDQIAEVAA
jgi:hypothetical protein